jgi:hypothetical protein
MAAIGCCIGEPSKMRPILLTLLFASLAAQAQDHAQDHAQERARSWSFVCDYYNIDVRGDLIDRDRVTAQYTRGAQVRWSAVGIAHGKEWADTFAAAVPSEFMNGFTYPAGDIKHMLEADFFHGFPPMAMKERNLVWDTHMLEGFALAYPDKLELDKPYHASSGDAALAGAGNFQNRDIQLTLVGRTKRNGEECALVNYSALFNKLKVDTGGITLTGRSNYWGQLWISTSTHQIEYATLFEDVLGELKLPGQQPQVINVFRNGSFEPIPSK